MTSEPFRSPAYRIIAVPFEKIIPNTYNPNSVAPPEMKLLYLSILEDGYTQPIVCYYSAKQDLYAIVDGFHRWRVMKEHRDIYEREQGMLPVAVIDKPLSNRMASTMQHHSARGAYLAVLHKVPAGYAAQAASKQLCKKIQDLDSVLARNGRRAL